MQLTEENLKNLVESYHKNGFAIIENFLSEKEVDELKRETVNYVREESAKLNGKVLPGEVWSGAPEKNEYYFNSGDSKTRLFYEPYAVNKEKLELLVPPEQALCKMGFALHMHRPYFLNFVRQKKVFDILRALDYIDPKIIQTMVNFKNPRVGGEFIPHQDTSYLTTTDPEYVVGFWFALDDATVENGCLDVIPGSHKWALGRKFVRCREGRKEDGSFLEWTGPMAVYDEKTYIKVPCKKGALVLIHGLLVHKSEPNHTDKSRWAFVFHTFDNKRCEYVEGWLPEKCPAFVPVYAN